MVDAGLYMNETSFVRQCVLDYGCLAQDKVSQGKKKISIVTISSVPQFHLDFMLTKQNVKFTTHKIKPYIQNVYFS